MDTITNCVNKPGTYFWTEMFLSSRPSTFLRQHGLIYLVVLLIVWLWFIYFNDISTFMGYLMQKPSLRKKSSGNIWPQTKAHSSAKNRWIQTFLETSSTKKKLSRQEFELRDLSSFFQNNHYVTCASTYTHTHTHTYIYIYIYIERESERISQGETL